MKQKLPEFRIYRNLHKECFSVTRWNPEKKGYRLFAHETDLILDKVQFRVSKAGREKVLREKQKNVHAFVYCENYSTFVGEDQLGSEVYYNPYKTETFQVKETGAPVYYMDSLIITNKKCYVNAGK